VCDDIRVVCSAYDWMDWKCAESRFSLTVPWVERLPGVECTHAICPFVSRCRGTDLVKEGTW